VTKKAKYINREAKQLLRLCIVGGLVDEGRVRQVVRRVLAAKRRECFPLVLRFRRLVELDHSQHTAEVESATALPEELKARVLGNLERVYGRGISTSFVQRPSLIGGMRIRVGGDVYDGSIKARLAALEERL
jgi:F-type H+-transporting ATPase subunit delta